MLYLSESAVNLVRIPAGWIKALVGGVFICGDWRTVLTGDNLEIKNQKKYLNTVTAALPRWQEMPTHLKHSSSLPGNVFFGRESRSCQYVKGLYMRMETEAVYFTVFWWKYEWLEHTEHTVNRCFDILILSFVKIVTIWVHCIFCVCSQWRRKL